VVSGIMEQSDGRDLAWQFAKSHWSEIEKIGAGSPLRKWSTQPPASAAPICTISPAVFTEHRVPTAERGLQQSLERIRYCVDLKSQQGPRLAQWLNEHENRAGQ